MNLEKRTKSIFYGMEFTHGIRRSLYFALILIYLLTLGFDLLAVTSLLAISGIVGLCFEFPTGAIADFNSRKKSLVISLFLFFVAFLGIFLFKNFWLISAFVILSEIAWTFSSGANFAWAIDNLKYSKNKSKLISFISKNYFFQKSGVIIGGLIGLVIVAINFRFIWLVISLSYLIMMFVMIKYAEEKNFKPSKIPGNYLSKSLIKAKESFSYIFHEKNRDLRMLMFWGFWVSDIAFSAFFVCLPLLFTQTLGLKPEFVPGINSLMALIALGIPLLAARLFHKRKNRFSLFILYTFVFLSVAVLAISGSLILALIVLALFNLGKASIDVVEESAVQHGFSSKIRASLGSINSINWSIAHAVGVFLAGLSIKFLGISTTLLISSCLILITAFIYLFGLRK